ncbi:MAG: T9SS type A sorting domain-containing protein, partial [bacterium]
FAAGNSANGDGVAVGSGDFILTKVESINGAFNVDVPWHGELPRPTTEMAVPYPNPMTKCTDISFAIAKGGLVDVSVFDLQGRKIRTIMHEFREAGPHGTFWDGRADDRSFARNGVYLIRLKGPDGGKVSRKIVLSR